MAVGGRNGAQRRSPAARAGIRPTLPLSPPQRPAIRPLLGRALKPRLGASLRNSRILDPSDFPRGLIAPDARDAIGE